MSSRASKFGIVCVFLAVAVVTALVTEEQLPYWSAIGALAVAIGGMLAAFGTGESKANSQRGIFGLGLIAIGGIMIAVAALKPLIVADFIEGAAALNVLL